MARRTPSGRSGTSCSRTISSSHASALLSPTPPPLPQTPQPPRPDEPPTAQPSTAESPTGPSTAESPTEPSTAESPTERAAVGRGAWVEGCGQSTASIGNAISDWPPHACAHAPLAAGQQREDSDDAQRLPRSILFMIMFTLPVEPALSSAGARGRARGPAVLFLSQPLFTRSSQVQVCVHWFARVGRQLRMLSGTVQICQLGAGRSATRSLSKQHTAALAATWPLRGEIVCSNFHTLASMDFADRVKTLGRARVCGRSCGLRNMRFLNCGNGMPSSLGLAALS